MTQFERRKLHLSPNFSHFLRRGAAILLLLLPLSGMGAQVLGPKGRDPGKSDRDLFIDAAKAYLGSPYVLGGSTARGLDCSGLVYRAALDGPDIQLPRTVETLATFAEHVTDSERDRGDLLFFNTTGKLSHVGIYLGNGQFVHSASDGPKTGVIVSKISESYWKKAYRFTGRIFKPSGPGEGLTGGGSSGSSASASGEARPGSGIAGLSDTPLGTNVFPYSGTTGLRLNATGAVLWDLMPGEFPLRGASAGAELSWAKGERVIPGAGVGFTWDQRTGSASLPVYASLGGVQGLRFFLGTQFHLLVGEDLSRDILFPGIIGLSWTSPPARIAGQNARFYQSAEYSAVAGETSGRGFRFTTGITLSYDL